MMNNINQKLIDVFASITDKQEMKQFLEEILTENEIQQLNKRWTLLEMLDEKVTQRTIAKSLKISLCKITRGSKILKNKESICHKYIRALNK
ncbi:MAG: Trp family transcriptional regulator [Kiritimatiellae bacterium]|jgi:TrpR family trp operon transcriptional repressor|nr:Trp family transcriptional regulator [Kiritimatiellia bacterium]